MAEVKFNAEKVCTCGEDIIKLVEELKLTYNGLFERLSKVPETTREWVGPTATNYFETVSKEKKIYMEYANELYKYGKFLIDISREHDKLTNEIRRDK